MTKNRLVDFIGLALLLLSVGTASILMIFISALSIKEDNIYRFMTIGLQWLPWLLVAFSTGCWFLSLPEDK